MATKKCIICGTIMENVRSDKKYCSHTCQNRAQYKNRNKARTKICEHCGKEFEPIKYGTSRKYCFECVPNTTQTGAEMRRILKQWSVEYKGNKCEECGYNKCIAALEFHHKNPAEKDFSISDKNVQTSWLLFKKELDKCSLLCSNCHREKHEKEGYNNA